jgi:uncharacterized protein (TIGR02118 family)
MIKVSILYPNLIGKKFDTSYYRDVHMPLSIKLLSAHSGYRGVSVERGVAGGLPGTEAAFVAMCHFLFDSSDSFMAAFTPHAGELQGDMAHVTDTVPVIQVSEVLISHQLSSSGEDGQEGS